MTHDEQLAEWVEGRPVHVEHGCCPDFSCCKPELLAPADVREKFATAGEQDRQMFLMGFLGAALSLMGKRGEVYIAGEHEGVGNA